MRFLIVIPIHNEAGSILACVQSLEAQTYRDFRVVLVDDGSSDDTPKLIDDFAQCHNRFSVLHLEPSEHQPGAKVVRTFYKGLDTQSLEDIEVICKFDADIIFPENYLQRLNDIYTDNDDVGMASGLLYIEHNGVWLHEAVANKNHIRGAIKSYRKECFQKMKGIRPTLGWDNIDVMLAQMYGYRVFVDRSIYVKQIRPTAYKYQSKKAEKLGEYFYNIGLDIPLAIISALKSALKNRSPKAFFVIIKTYWRQNHQHELTSEEIAFIRKYRRKQMLNKIFLKS
ncbi:glycosyltransferase [Riemerella columbipharyngis]|uniref:Glycosyl transferase family 2 n=1 Tax=Riemerella columbipharyngis TaxID=1071918 RepID=A0A1G7ES47_9FLAO|nr:glycosyltransferase family 2 protein [Riemerella columbipharyngis]SDE66500.1 Glycosyl transferase family 2 [Riemerella columbipharyngis]